MNTLVETPNPSRWEAVAGKDCSEKDFFLAALDGGLARLIERRGLSDLGHTIREVAEFEYAPMSDEELAEFLFLYYGGDLDDLPLSITRFVEHLALYIEDRYGYREGMFMIILGLRHAWHDSGLPYLTYEFYKDWARKNGAYDPRSMWHGMTWNQLKVFAGLEATPNGKTLKHDDPEIAKRCLENAMRHLPDSKNLTHDWYGELSAEQNNLGSEDFPYSNHAIITALGATSWGDALIKAGLAERKFGFTDDEYIGVVKDVAEWIGGIPRVADYKRYRAEVRPDIPTHINLRKRLGQWDEVLIAASLC